MEIPSKLLNTYVDALPKQVDTKTERIYAEFNQAVASTGRLSSNNPNLQNIPIRNPRGEKSEKHLFVKTKITLCYLLIIHR